MKFVFDVHVYCTGWTNVDSRMHITHRALIIIRGDDGHGVKICTNYLEYI